MVGCTSHPHTHLNWISWWWNVAERERSNGGRGEIRRPESCYCCCCCVTLFYWGFSRASNCYKRVIPPLTISSTPPTCFFFSFSLAHSFLVYNLPSLHLQTPLNCLCVTIEMRLLWPVSLLNSFSSFSYPPLYITSFIASPSCSFTHPLSRL